MIATRFSAHSQDHVAAILLLTFLRLRRVTFTQTLQTHIELLSWAQTRHWSRFWIQKHSFDLLCPITVFTKLCNSRFVRFHRPVFRRRPIRMKTAYGSSIIGEVIVVCN